MYEVPKGAKKVEPAEFWKPVNKGDCVIGVVSRFSTNRFQDGNVGQNVTLEPVVVWPAAGEPGGFGSVAVGVNSSLQSQVSAKLEGKPIVIKYLGKKATQGGPTPMRLFGVAILPPDEWAALQARFLKAEGAAVPETLAPADGEDDPLPF